MRPTHVVRSAVAIAATGRNAQPDSVIRFQGRPLNAPICARKHCGNIGAAYPNVLKFGFAHRRELEIVTMLLVPVGNFIGERSQSLHRRAQKPTAGLTTLANFK